ncbi:hypothetical protein COBT_001610 [Conglomerata obtusa]
MYSEKKYKKTLYNLINKFVDNQYILHTNSWRGYIGAVDYVILHKIVNHTVSFVNYDDEVHTNTIEGNWSAVKAFIPRRYRKKKFISTWQHYFMFRRNHVGDSVLKFIKILK